MNIVICKFHKQDIMNSIIYCDKEVKLHPSLTIFIGEDNMQMLDAIKKVNKTALFYDGCPSIKQLRQDIDSNQDSVVLIKNVERDLYPSHQQKIITTLLDTFPDTQFIITTHSPYIVGSVKSDYVREVFEGTVYGVDETYGRPVDWITKVTFRVDSSVISKEVTAIHRAHTEGNYELSEKLYSELCDKIPEYDMHPDLILISSMFTRRRILGK